MHLNQTAFNIRKLNTRVTKDMILTNTLCASTDVVLPHVTGLTIS